MHLGKLMPNDAKKVIKLVDDQNNQMNKMFGLNMGITNEKRTAYFKSKNQGAVLKNFLGQRLVTVMTDFELETALDFGEFNGVQDYRR